MAQAPKTATSNSVLTMIIGFLMVLFTSPCVAVMIHDLVVGTDNVTGALMVGLFCAILSLAGLFVFRVGWKSRHHVPSVTLTAQRERTALQAIRSAGGEVTTASLAMLSDLSIAEATSFLENLEKQGVANSWITTEGAVSYRVPHLSGRHTSVDANDAVFDFPDEQASADSPGRVGQSASRDSD